VSGQKKHLTNTDFAHNMGRDMKYYAQGDYNEANPKNTKRKKQFK
jgi:hypothetical protein